MATSGSSDWTLTRDQIIREALERIGVFPPGSAIPVEIITSATVTLHALVKSLQNEDIFLWTRERKTKTLTASSEVTGTDSSIYTCIRSHTSAATSKPVTGADYSTYWIKRGATGGVWTTGTAYSSIGDFVVDANIIDIEKVFVRDADADSSIEIISLSKYMDITNKGNTGKPTRMAVDRQLIPRIYLYPQPDLTSYVIHYLATRKLEDFDNGDNTPDFPERWISMLITGLAYKLSFKYGSSALDRAGLKVEADREKMLAKRADSENEDMSFFKGAF